jgi:hypothetical protein
MSTDFERFSKTEWEVLKDVARTIRYFVRDRKYGYVDKLANAFTAQVAEVALREAIRDARSAADQGEKVHLPSDNVIKDLIELLKRDLSAAGVLATLALVYPSTQEVDE